MTQAVIAPPQTASTGTLTPADGTRLYAGLHRQITAAGILDRDYRYYAIVLATIVAGLAISLFYVITLPVSVGLAVWAIMFAIMGVQVCGIVHDAGHRTIFKSVLMNTIVGESAGGLLGMGFNSWRVVHNVHHAHTNEEGTDPDLDIPLHAFTVRQFERQGGLWRYARRYQAFVFYPLRTLVVFSRRLANIMYFRQQPFGPRLVGEIALWVVGLAVWFVAPFIFFPLGKVLLLFVIVHPLMGFYLSNIFAPNHKGMPQLPPEANLSFLEQQIITSRNIKPNWFTDALYMGLNYQIEHHLFPKCPRNKLRYITPYVRDLCRQFDLPFTEAGIIESNKIILRELNNVARTSR